MDYRQTDQQATRDYHTGGLCPICGEHITLTGDQTTDGRIIGTCGDAFTRDEWEAPED